MRAVEGRAADGGVVAVAIHRLVVGHIRAVSGASVELSGARARSEEARQQALELGARVDVAVVGGLAKVCAKTAKA